MYAIDTKKTNWGVLARDTKPRVAPRYMANVWDFQILLTGGTVAVRNFM